MADYAGWLEIDEKTFEDVAVGDPIGQDEGGTTYETDEPGILAVWDADLNTYWLCEQGDY